jgi:hypothetical protein
MCAGDLGEEHGHLVAKQTSAPMCVCYACYHVFFLVTNGHPHHDDEARYRYFPHFSTEGMDHGLDLPAGLTFLFHTSVEDRLATWSPSADGAIEIALPVTSWPALLAANPGLDTLRPLCDALLLRRKAAWPLDDTCLLLPSQACFELIASAKSRGRPTVQRLQEINAAMEDLWARARAEASSVPEDQELRQG